MGVQIMKKKLVLALTIACLFLNLSLSHITPSSTVSESKIYAGEIDPEPVRDVIKA